MQMWHLKTWFSGEPGGGAGLTAGLGDLRVFSNLKHSHDGQQAVPVLCSDSPFCYPLKTCTIADAMPIHLIYYL